MVAGTGVSTTYFPYWLPQTSPAIDCDCGIEPYRKFPLVSAERKEFAAATAPPLYVIGPAAFEGSQETAKSTPVPPFPPGYEAKTSTPTSVTVVQYESCAAKAIARCSLQRAIYKH